MPQNTSNTAKTAIIVLLSKDSKNLPGKHALYLISFLETKFNTRVTCNFEMKKNEYHVVTTPLITSLIT